MKRSSLLGTAAVVVALTLFSATPSFAKGGGGHGGHGGGHGGHGHGGHGGHSHGSAHHAGVAHHNGGHGHAGHNFGNHSFAHNHAGWGHGYGHGWGHGYGHGWGYGGYGWGWRNRGLGYWGGWGPGYVGTSGVGPSYYYSNTVTDPIFPPVTTTVRPQNVTEVIEPVTSRVPPAPVAPIQIGSAQPVDDTTSGTQVPGPTPTSAS